MTSAEKIDTRGFVFAATGDTYVALARRAARSLRLVHPEAEIDLFTDTAVADPTFSQIHMLSESWFRPKMEALRRSRFDRSIFLDADLMVVADLTDAFEVLDRFEFAACHDRYLNNRFARLTHRRKLPDAFPVYNSGVMAVRRSEASELFLERWEREMKEAGSTRDQPALRELLYDSDLRLCTLPPGFNFLTFNELSSWWGIFGAPRVLHSAHLHRRREGPGDPSTPFTMHELVGRRNARRVAALIKADYALTPDAPVSDRKMNDPLEPGVLRSLRQRIAPLWHWMRER